MAKNQAHPESEIALFVRAARKALKLTQEQFGDKFNRTKANANAWELGRHEPAFSLLKVMSFESGVPLPASIKSDLNGLDTDAVQSKPHTNEALISNLQDWRLQASCKRSIDQKQAESSIGTTTPNKPSSRRFFYA